MTRSHPDRAETTPSMSRRNLFKLGGGAAALLLVGCSADRPVAAVPENASTPDDRDTIDLTDISPEGLRRMTPEQRLDAIRIPESALEDPEEYIRTYNKYLEGIYNAGSSDAEYMWFINEGPGTKNVDYVDYVFNTYHKPMLEQLQGHSPSDSLEGEGALTIATRLNTVLYMRLELGRNDLEPYHFTIKVGELKKVSSEEPPMNITYVYLMGDTISKETLKAMKEEWEDPAEYNIIDDTPIICTMVGVRYKEDLNSVAPEAYLFQ